MILSLGKHEAHVNTCYQQSRSRAMAPSEKEPISCLQQRYWSRSTMRSHVCSLSALACSCILRVGCDPISPLRRISHADIARYLNRFLMYIIIYPSRVFVPVRAIDLISRPRKHIAVATPSTRQHHKRQTSSPGSVQTSVENYYS